MNVVYNKKNKICEVWLTSDEKNDSALKTSLSTVFKVNKSNGYLTVVYESGTRDLYENTLALLVHNKEVVAREERESSNPA